MTPTPTDAAGAIRAALLEAGWTLAFDGASFLHPEMKLVILNDPAGLLGLETIWHHEFGIGSTLFGIDPGTGRRYRRAQSERWAVKLANLPAATILAAASTTWDTASGTVPEQLIAAGWSHDVDTHTDPGEYLLERSWASSDRLRTVVFQAPCRHEPATWVIKRPRPGSPSTSWIDGVEATGNTPPAIIAAVATS
ncbi:MAG: hypothetical protein HOV83_35785 [Catenulispora sp.]|nr:hypothetical protein [Catenulispora sp.]